MLLEQWLASKSDSSYHSMKRLLYLAYCFPPAPFIASVRTWNVARQLARIGWQVTVVTPHPSLWRRIDSTQPSAEDAAKEGLELLHTGHYWPWLVTDYLRNSHPRFAWAVGGPFRKLLRSCGLEGYIGWIPAVKSACARYRPGDIDVVLGTGNPFVTFGLARSLARRLHCPYVLDYRDLWTGNPGRAQVPWIRWTERRILGAAAAITIVSKSLTEVLAQHFGVSDRVHVISNGYNATEQASLQPLNFCEPAVVYAGTLYPPNAVLDPVFSALSNLNRSNIDWKFHYYGSMTSLVADAAKRAGITNRLVLHGQVPRREALAAAKGAHCAVVVTSVLDTASASERGIVTGKIFELVGMGVPILLVAPPFSDAEAVVGTCGHRFSGSQINEMTSYLADLLTSPRRSFTPPPEYDWETLGMRLHQVLEGIVRGPTGTGRRIW